MQALQLYYICALHGCLMMLAPRGVVCQRLMHAILTLPDSCVRFLVLLLLLLLLPGAGRD
jgi:hypothetical protein